MVTGPEYCGFPNRETWAVVLHMRHREEPHGYAKQLTRGSPDAEWAGKTFCEWLHECVLENLMEEPAWVPLLTGDLLHAFFARVDKQRVGQAMLELHD